MKEHPTKNIVIKQADVDLLMIPVVDWLNSFDEVTTLFCCQGTDGQEKPYVLFTCTDPLELILILDLIQHHASVEVVWSRDYPFFRYHATFHDRLALKAVTEKLEFEL